MNRPVLVHGLLLGLALVAAYFVWTREPSTSEDEIPILSVRSGLDRVVYSAPERTVEITHKKDDQGYYYWIRAETVEEKRVEPPKPPTPAKPDAGPPSPTKPTEAKPADKNAKPADGGPAAAKPDTGPPAKPAITVVRKVQEFKGNKAAEDLMKALSNMTAIRSLGMVEPAKLEAFELAKSEKTLTLVTGSSPRTLIVGGNTFGNMDVYIQDKQDKRVYVVRPRQLQDLQYAEFRLVDRQLHPFPGADVERAMIATGKAKKTLVQQNRRDPANAYWADEAAPEKRKEFYRNFMGKLLRLQALEYVPPKTKPDNLTEILAVTYQVVGGKRGFLRLFRRDTAAKLPVPAPGAPGGEKEYYAVTDNTRGQVKLSSRLADEIARDIDNLMKD
jgi:hypothetical protein